MSATALNKEMTTLRNRYRDRLNHQDRTNLRRGLFVGVRSAGVCTNAPVLSGAELLTLIVHEPPNTV